MFHSSTCCRLCINFCNDPQSLYYADGRKSEVYQLMEKYFIPMFLDMERGRHFTVICTDCWSHIFNFHNFQHSVLLAQRKLVEVEQQSAAAILLTIDDQQSNSQTANVPYCNESTSVAPLDSTVITTIHNYTSSVSCIKQEVDRQSDEFLAARVDQQSNNSITLKTDESNSATVTSTSTTTPTISRYNRNDVFLDDETAQRPKTVVKTENPLLESGLPAQENSINNDLPTSEADDASYDTKFRPVPADDEDIKTNTALEFASPYDNSFNSSDDNSDWEEFDDPVGVFIGGEFNNNRNCESDGSNDEDSLLECPMAVQSGENRSTRKNESNSNQSAQLEENAKCDSNSTTSDQCQHKETKMHSLDLKRPKTVEEFDDFIARWRPNLECAICKESCSRFTQLLQHFNDQHPNEEFHIQCCQLKLHHRYEMEKHIHYHQQAFKCEVCLKCFSRKNSLDRHLREKHSETPKDVFKCPQCPNFYISKNALKVHIKYGKHQEKEEITKAHTCSECGNKYVHLRGLVLHKKLVHLNSGKMNKCTICDKAYMYPNSLKQHMVVHSRISRHKCPYCTKTYSYKNTVRNHIRRHHPNKRDDK